MKKFNCNEEFASEALQNVVGGNVDNFSMTWSAKASADTCEKVSNKDHDSDLDSSVELAYLHSSVDEVIQRCSIAYT